MEFVKIDPAVRAALIEYLTQNNMGPGIRLQTMGIGCMGAVINFITDVKKDDDMEMSFSAFSFLANKMEAETYGGYFITASKSGIRIKTVNRITGGCETCYNTLHGEGCH